MGNNYLQYSIRQEAEQYIGAMTELTGIDLQRDVLECRTVWLSWINL